LYQLTSAEGREHPGQQPGPVEPAGLRLDPPNDMNGLRRYRESYDHDPAGNILRTAHVPLGGSGALWTRAHAYAPDSNRLLATSGPSDPPGTLSLRYDYDLAGN